MFVAADFSTAAAVNQMRPFTKPANLRLDIGRIFRYTVNVFCKRLHPLRLLPAKRNFMPESRSRPGVTIADVAERAGVSTATVSRVINQTARVAPETEAQVRAAIARLNYRPRTAAQVLAGRRTDTLGLLLPEIGDDFFCLMLRGIEAAARENGFGLLIHSTEATSSPSATMSYPLGEHNTDGLLVFTDHLPGAELERLHQMRFPVVLLHHSPPEGLDVPCVTVENQSGARQVIEHLIQVHGCRRIAFLTGPEGNEDSYWRELGYRKALAAHGIACDPILLGMGGFDDEVAQETVKRWLKEGLEFDAIFAGDDAAAIGALTALDEAGKRVPQDVALVGFDDTYLSRYLSPPLTTVRAPIEQVGQEAVWQLVRLIRTGRADSLVLLPTELVIRRSCGCSVTNIESQARR
jgi:LacI family transcriptional regulator